MLHVFRTQASRFFTQVRSAVSEVQHSSVNVSQEGVPLAWEECSRYTYITREVVRKKEPQFAKSENHFMMSTSRRGRSTPDLLFSLELEKKSDQPFHRQLGMQVRQAILDGRLLPGARLPSTRTLAKILHISRNSVVVAYEELCAEGYLTGTHGSGTFVASDFPPLPRPIQSKMRHAPRWLSHPLPFIEGEEASQPGMLAFRLGATTTTSLSPRLWRSIWRDVAMQPLPNDYGPPEGEGMLRSAIARYLERARGVVCRAENMVITSGTVQALDLLARATLSAGDLVGIEEPGYPLARQVFQARQARLVPIAVDHDGLQVQTLPHGPSAPLLVYVTPSHQYPLASRLSIARRLALLEWARTHDSLIVEDDYDSEFRFDAPPLPALAGLDTSGQVAYIGSFSKILSPALRVGYLVASAELCERITYYKLLTDYHTSWPVQRALTVLLTEGHLERHIQRMRHHYAEKRALLSSVLAPLAPKAQLLGLEAGLHAYLELSPRFKTKALVEQAQKQGLVVTPLDEYYLGTPDRNGLVLGYGGLEHREILRGGQILAEIIQQMS